MMRLRCRVNTGLKMAALVLDENREVLVADTNDEAEV